MKKLSLAVLLTLLAACAPAPQEAEQAAPPEPPAPPAEEATVSYPDPDAAVAEEVQAFVTGWVGERLAEDGTYAIPPRAGHAVAGTMADFHTVHQKDADTYSVCVDFESGEQLYDVDFFVDRTEQGLVLADHYLHKIDGEAVE